MTDDASSAHHVRQTPRKRAGESDLADFTSLVRVPGLPTAVRAYTDAEGADAARYAAEIGGEVVALPLPPPRGYSANSDGLLTPDAPDGAVRA